MASCSKWVESRIIYIYIVLFGKKCSFQLNRASSGTVFLDFCSMCAALPTGLAALCFTRLHSTHVDATTDGQILAWVISRLRIMDLVSEVQDRKATAYSDFKIFLLARSNQTFRSRGLHDQQVLQPGIARPMRTGKYTIKPANGGGAGD